MTIFCMIGLPLVVPVAFTLCGRREAKSAWIGALAGGAPGVLFGLVSCSIAQYGDFPAPTAGVPGDELAWAIAGFYGWLLGSIGGIVGALVGVTHAQKKWGRSDDSALVCRDCGYDLRGLPKRRCPECGRRF